MLLFIPARHLVEDAIPEIRLVIGFLRVRDNQPQTGFVANILTRPSSTVSGKNLVQQSTLATLSGLLINTGNLLAVQVKAPELYVRLSDVYSFGRSCVRSDISDNWFAGVLARNITQQPRERVVGHKMFPPGWYSYSSPGNMVVIEAERMLLNQNRILLR